MKSRFLELIPDFQNDIEISNAISAWPFSASVGVSFFAKSSSDFGSMLFLATCLCNLTN